MPTSSAHHDRSGPRTTVPDRDPSGADRCPGRLPRPTADPHRLFGHEPRELLQLIAGVVAPAVDEERGRAVHAAHHPAPEMSPDLRGPVVGVEVVPESVELDARAAGPGLEIAAGEAVLVLEDQIVHFPEPALRARRLGGFGRELRVWMQVLEREIPEPDADQVTRLLLELLEDRVGRSAKGTFEVPILDEGHRGRGRTAEMVVLVDRRGEQGLLIGSHHASAAARSSRAPRIPSAPGFTPTGERWLQRTMPPPSITNNARSVVPSPSRYT